MKHNFNSTTFSTNINQLIKSENKNNFLKFFNLKRYPFAWQLLKLSIQMFLIVVAVFTITFFLVEIIPGNPKYIQELIGSRAPDEIIEAAKEMFHLNDPLFARYGYAFMSMFDGTLGISGTYGIAVSNILMSKFFLSVQIALFSMALSVIFGIPLGFFLARRDTKTIDFVSVIIAIIAFAVPAFIVGIVFMIASYSLGLPSIFEFGNWYSMFIVGLSIALPVGLGYSRYLRQSVKEEYAQQYVKLARIKGASEKYILRKHVFKPSLFPIINYLPLLVIGVIIGAITVESIFSVPGTGTLMVNAAIDKDQAMLVSITTLYTILVVIAIFIRDISLRWIDPRMRDKK